MGRREAGMTATTFDLQPQPFSKGASMKTILERDLGESFQDKRPLYNPSVMLRTI
jgi:hypothetical protein